MKRINDFHRAESFNKVSLREISDKYKELQNRRNNRVKNAEKSTI